MFQPTDIKNSPFGIDARLKVLVLMAILVMILSSRGAWFPLTLCIISLSWCIGAGIRKRMILLRLTEPIFVIVVLVILKSLSGEVEIFSFNLLGLKINIFRDGLIEGALLALRILGAVSAVAAMSLTTPFTELLGAMSWLKIPGSFVEITMFAHRYMQSMFEDAQVIYNSQKTRLGYSSARRSLGSIGTLAGSLVIKAFDQAESTAASLHQRGYDGTIPLYNNNPISTKQAIASAAFCMATFGLWILCRG